MCAIIFKQIKLRSCPKISKYILLPLVLKLDASIPLELKVEISAPLV
jgi:hypothetical protein